MSDDAVMPTNGTAVKPAPQAEVVLACQGLRKRYDEGRHQVSVLQGTDLQVHRGERIAIVGASGSGKSTLLHLLGGLDAPSEGSVSWLGRDIVSLGETERGEQRNRLLGFVYQFHHLLPEFSALENVAMPLRIRRVATAPAQRAAADLLTRVGLADRLTHLPGELSGGERQRVALARSLAPSPRLLMLDEPLGALDRALRERLLDELRGILKRVGVTSIYVTHDQAEAFAIADWLVLMNAGRIEQQGTPEQVYRRPASRFAARFLGHTNLLEGRVADLAGDLLLVDTPLGRLASADLGGGLRPGDAVVLVIRPEAGLLGGAGGPNRVAGVLAERSFRGGHTRVTLQPEAGPALELDLADAELPPLGSPLVVGLRPAAISVLRS